MSFLTEYIVDGYIYINEINWKNLQYKYSKDEIVDCFVNEVLNENIKFPYKKISLQDMKKDFNNLMNYTCNDYFQGSEFKIDYKYKSSGKYIFENNFSYASDYFHQNARMECGNQRCESPIEIFKIPARLKRLFNGFFVFNKNKITSDDILAMIDMRFYIASKFKCSVAKSIYEKFNSEYILDFSSGWGDRLAGFYACKNTKKYIGIDPNKKVFDEYFKQAKIYQDIIDSNSYFNLFDDCDKKEVELYNLPAEDVQLQDECVDTVFTSPPYFNFEVYSKDETNSCNRYKQLDEWFNNFLIKVIDLSWKALKYNGYLILNICDRSDVKFCDRMNDYISTKLGAKYIDCIGMKISKRPNQKFDVDNLCEPIWIWKKLKN